MKKESNPVPDVPKPPPPPPPPKCMNVRESVEEGKPRRHPPIPPNCDSFEDCGGLWVFKFSFRHSVFIYEVDSKSWKYGRRIIAAVARCAWMDEADRLRAGFFDRYHCVTSDVRCEWEIMKAGVDKALANERAWMRWGNGRWSDEEKGAE